MENDYLLYMENDKKIIITESELKNIIRESVKKTLVKEGIDVDGENMTVGFNPNHQKYVNTNDPWEPYPIYNNIDGYKVISVFEREITDDKQDGNPLIYALKSLANGERCPKWSFRNKNFDIMALLRRFVAVTKELKEEFDVIITTPSSNPLNTEILHRIIRIINHENSFEEFFIKFTANEVYRDFIDSEWLTRTYPNEAQCKKMHSNIYKAICKMNLPKEQKGNDGIFSYKFLKPSELRSAIVQSMYINDDFRDELTYGPLINGKKVLIIDDTVTSGKTISDSADAVKEMYDPISITFLTLFSPLKK